MIFYLTGNHDEDFFLTVDDMPKENWGIAGVTAKDLGR